MSRLPIMKPMEKNRTDQARCEMNAVMVRELVYCVKFTRRVTYLATPDVGTRVPLGKTAIVKWTCVLFVKEISDVSAAI